MMIMGFIYYVLYLVVVHWNTVVYSLDCLSCQQIDDPHTCNTTISCPDKQVCFLNEQGGIYSLGCADNQHCGGVGGPGIVGRGIKAEHEFGHDFVERQSSTCLECCSTDRCNSDLCKHPKLNGNWTQWTTWSNCDVTCSKGVQTRSRTCTNPAPANGGRDCSGSASETKLCQRDPCPVHGGWSTWSQWGSCSASCDVGMQRRDRSCSSPYPDIGGNHCFGESRDDRICFSSACSDGGWSTWSSWGTCSETCGGGIRSHTRTCTNPKPSILGKSCDGNAIQVSVCNRQACSDGAWSSWSSWGSCSVTCGVGIRSQTRTCTQPKPSLLGKYCDGTPMQVSICNKQTCPDYKVSFTAYGTTGTSPVVFPHAIENYGNGYDKTTGRFTCKLPGIYNFAVQISKQYIRLTDLVECYIYKNSAKNVGAIEDPLGTNSEHDREGYSISISATFHLNKNDYVYIGCRGISAIYTNNESSFTGFLVTPDN